MSLTTIFNSFIYKTKQLQFKRNANSRLRSLYCKVFANRGA